MIFANECRKAVLDALAAQFNSGSFVLTTAINGGGSELASLTFGATAFAGASTASPSVAVSNDITAAADPVAGTILGFALQTSAGATRISGSVGVGSGDIQVSSNVIPDGTLEVSCTAGLQITLQISA